MSTIDEAVRWWLCFKWKYEGPARHVDDVSQDVSVYLLRVVFPKSSERLCSLVDTTTTLNLQGYL